MDKITTFSEYSKRAAETQMESCKGLDYLDLGFVGEVAGELCGELIAKSIRGDFALKDRAFDIMDESGDACWFADRKCVAQGTSLAAMLMSDDIAKVDKEMLKAAIVSDFDKQSDYQLGKALVFYSCSVIEFGYNIDTLSRNLQLFFAHLVVLLHRFGCTLSDAMNHNVEKLAKRKERGLIQGSGDHCGEVNMVVESCPASTWRLPINTGITLEEGINSMNNFQSAIHSNATGGYIDEGNRSESDAPSCGCVD